MNVWLVTPAWGRYAVSDLVFAQRAHLAETLAPRGLRVNTLVVADDDNIELAREWGLHSLYVRNEPLGRKWNDGLEWACTVGEADYVAVVGSDDWVHPDLFDVLPNPDPAEVMPTDDSPVVVGRVVPEAVTGRSISMVDLASGRLRVCVSRGAYGVIPWVFPRVALERCGFRPVKDQASRWLDGSLASGLGVRPRWVFHDPHDVCRVDFKSDVNLNSYGQITGAVGVGEEVDAWGALAARYPAELVKQAHDLSLSLAVAA